MMRAFVQTNGGKFLVGLQYADPDLEPFLTEQKIPYTRFDGAASLPDDPHWSPHGHETVAERLMTLFVAEHVIKAAGERQ
jgi:hypothetical protein